MIPIPLLITCVPGTLNNIFEIAGMKLVNGKVITSDPLKKDTDEDGLTDLEEMGRFKTEGSFSGSMQYKKWFPFYKSDPTLKDTDGDDIIDPIDARRLIPDEGTGEVNEKYVTKEQLTAMKFTGVDDDMVTSLNDTLELYGITAPIHIQHFLAQCRQEGSLSLTEAGWCSVEYVKKYTMMYEPGVPSYRSDGSVYYKAVGLGNTEEGDGYRFRGGGYIQITGRANYQAFANSLNDEVAAQKIMSEGADAIKENYARQAAGFWWFKEKMNERIDNGATLLEISRAVNIGPNATTGTPNHMTERKIYYELAQDIIH